MLLSALSSIVISPWPRTLIFFGSMPRSPSALVNAIGCAPPGMKMKIASGLRSLARCTKAEKSGLATGMRTEPTISPPASLKPCWNAGLRVDARAIVRDHRVDLLHAVLVGPRAEGLLELRNGQRGARDVGRLGGDDGGRRVHHHHELLGFRRHVGGGERFRRQREAGEDVDLVAHDQFLRETLGDVGRDAAGVLADEFDLLAGDRVAVLLHVELDGIVHLRGGVGELARVGHDQTDLDGLLRVRRGCRDQSRGKNQKRSSA